MITQGQQSQLKELLSLVEDYKNPPLDQLIKTLNLPSWFNTDYCVIVMNKMHENQFKGYEVDWLYFSDYIYFDQMIVMDKRTPYTPLTTYAKGDLNDSLYKRPI